jgi:hypothetical protein
MRTGRRWRRAFVWLLALIALVGVSLALLVYSLQPKTLARLPLGDGRILQIEGVTYGLKHRTGSDSIFKRVAPWLPSGLHRYLGLEQRANDITLDRPGLVIWVNAVSEKYGTNIDCQGIRVEMEDQHGDLLGESTRSWFGGQTFWRVGHVFYCYPRDESKLMVHVTPWQKGQKATARISNPQPSQLASWTGKGLPQSEKVGPFEVRLSNLTTRTNGEGKKAYYETATRYFKPVFEVLENGQPAGGWSKPEWSAESPNGNRGQFLGIHQPVLRFISVTYPEVTNVRAAQLIVSLPPINVATMTTNQWWNSTNSYASNSVIVLGMFQRGTHNFSQGIYESSSATVNGPRGGAPSGWTGQSRQINPLQMKYTDSHYTPVPTIYIQVKSPQADPRLVHSEVDLSAEELGRLAIRLRDEHGLYWLAKSEGSVQGIQPFLVQLPPEVTNVVAELILLKPIKAEFLVDTKSGIGPN